MTKPHVHAELIKAWADGAEIQFYSSSRDKWVDLAGFAPLWCEVSKYRIKPDPHAEFKAALARGERVDMRAKGLPPGRGWIEVPPSFDFKGAPAMEFRIALPWQDERDAYDRGEQIQYLSHLTGRWCDASAPAWLETYEWRVKPKETTETFRVFGLMQSRPGPHDGVTLRPAPFDLPTIALDISYADGKVTNITLKDWKP